MGKSAKTPAVKQPANKLTGFADGLFVLMSVFSQFFLALMSSDFSELAFSSAGHCNSPCPSLGIMRPYRTKYQYG
jgi:hypothetical protein